MNSNHQTGVGDKESNARKTQASVLEGKTYSVSHLQSTLQIFQNTYSSSAYLIIWVIWFLSKLSCMSLLYILGYEALTKYVVCKYIFFSFHRLSFHFMDGFFYYAKGFEFDMVSLVYFAVLAFAFDDWVVWDACILVSNPLSVVYLLLSSSILTKRHRLAEWIQKQEPYICCL